MKRSIFITGCSTGIGYTAARQLQQHGFNVIASCRKEEDVIRLQKEGLTCLQLDYNDPKSVSDAVKKIKTLTDGKLYALFNNGAYGQAGALEDLPRDALKEQFEANFFGWHQLVTELLPIMREQNQGRIIQNSSVLGIVAMKYRGAYNASKFAIEGWTDTLRLELSDTNIKVCLIEPGPIETEFRANALKAFNKWIDVENSPHKEKYLIQQQRLEKEKSGSAFVLPSTAVISPLLHALNSTKPKVRYRVTFPTYLFAFLKRILPTKILDKILNKSD
ncbi:short-chain dehydrogenase [Aliivibrio fischeri]|uniref:SDR family oxidoreductase n=1 Tax=Aliivibrio fischeri TaxID=668 RepID=UPI00080EDF0D|nr:SDR family oxidoreductase [Aliivibrio fischeri]OCH12548.1 short-chain dehydrogenase [Aliivibrio fischeri]OCH24928.1 short-chain dehydrogenase [Aliivibrio fischeri]